MGSANVKLTDQEVEAVTKIAEEAEVNIPGGRYAAAQMRYTYADTPEEK